MTKKGKRTRSNIEMSEYDVRCCRSKNHNRSKSRRFHLLSNPNVDFAIKAPTKHN